MVKSGDKKWQKKVSLVGKTVDTMCSGHVSSECAMKMMIMLRDLEIYEDNATGGYRKTSQDFTFRKVLTFHGSSWTLCE